MSENPVTAQQVIKSFLPGTQHLAEQMIVELRNAGFEIVPKEATDEMLTAATKVMDDADREGMTPKEWYAAMVGAYK